MIKFTGDLRCDFEKAAAEIEKQKDRILGYQEKIAGLRESVNKLKKSKEKDKKQYQESLAEKDAVIKELQNRLAHAEALLNHDGSNTGTPTGESEIKYEYDVRIKVVKIKHEFFCYKCNNCGTVFRSQIPPVLKEKVQYGSELQTLALSLTNTVNASMNKASMFLAGITGGELTPCEGYVAKLQVRAAKGLQRFRADLKLLLITRKIIYRDDTVIMILTKRACFRFYGDEKLDQCLADGWSENEADPDNYGASWERTLLNRIAKFRRPYFLWVEDFSLPTTNNLSERGLRGVKSHMKISGQFESEAAADNHALIKTYIETCRRNGINEIHALERLCAGNPYTVDEIFSSSTP